MTCVFPDKNTLFTALFVLSIIGALTGLVILDAAANAGTYTLAPVGTGLILFFIVMLLFIKYRNKRNIKNEHIHFRKNLENHYDKVIIPLDKFKIKSNSWNQRINHGSEKIPDFKEVAFHRVHISQVIQYKGSRIKIEEFTETDPVVLKMKFALQKTTILYIKNSRDYYLDLDFLYSK